MNENLARVGERIKLHADYWQEVMDLGWFAIHHHYHDKFEENDTEVHPWTLAITTPDWEYRQARIDWYLYRASTLSDEDLEAGVVHELCHILVAPIESELKVTPLHSKLGEYAVESLSRAMLAIRKNVRGV